jgi:transcriptional regulator with XRE-family HTH domain
MDDARLGASVRALRHRRDWRQVDLSQRCGVSRSQISLLERGFAQQLALRAIRRVAGALELRLGWDAGFRGAELDRLRDRDHAGATDLVAGRLQSWGWFISPEVSFNVYGDRGRIDLLAYHPASMTLLVVEVKTTVSDVQDVIGRLDVKVRLAPRLVRERFGWRAQRVVRCLTVVEGTTNRRHIAQHAHLCGGFALRGRPAWAWLRQAGQWGRPAQSGVDGLLLLLKLPHDGRADRRRAGRQRVRLRQRPASSDAVLPGPSVTRERA